MLRQRKVPKRKATQRLVRPRIFDSAPDSLRFSAVWALAELAEFAALAASKSSSTRRLARSQTACDARLHQTGPQTHRCFYCGSASQARLCDTTDFTRIIPSPSGRGPGRGGIYSVFPCVPPAPAILLCVIHTLCGKIRGRSGPRPRFIYYKHEE